MSRGTLPLLLLVLLAPAHVHSAPRFRLVDLGLPAGAIEVTPTHFGPGNEVLGSFWLPGTLEHAAEWTVSPLGEPLGMVDLLGLDGFTWSAANARNASGWVVGHSNTADPQPRAVLWRDGQRIDIERAADGNANIYALGVNDAGQIVGFMTKSGGGGGWDPVMWTEDPNHPGRFDRTILPMPPNATGPFAWAEGHQITASGLVFGRVNLGPRDRAIFWLPDSAHTTVLLDPLAPSEDSMPGDCNEAGVAVGYTMFPFEHDRATIWANDAAHTATELARWPGYNMARAEVVDPAGTLVLGRSALIDDSVYPWITVESRIVIWRDGAVYDLNESLDASGTGWVVEQTADMNADDWILASARPAGGALRAVILIPVPEVAGVSAPATGVTFAPPSPNPARADVRLAFTLDHAGRAAIRIVDPQGRRVATPFEGPLPAGPHEVRWSGSEASGRRAAPGVYFAVLEAGGTRTTRRVAIVP